MKKTMIALVALTATFAACTKSDDIKISNGPAINFAGSYIENATKAELTTDNIAHFKAFANVGGTAFWNDITVSKGASAWTHNGSTQYWIKNSNYGFAAYAPANANVSSMAYDAANNKLGFNFTSDGETDLLLGAETVTTKGDFSSGVPDAVQIPFSHALSKVQFKFKNTEADNVRMTINSVKVYGFGTGCEISQSAISPVTVAGGSQVAEANGYDLTAPAAFVGNNTVETPSKFYVPQTMQGNVKVKINVKVEMKAADGNTWIPMVTNDKVITIPASSTSWASNTVYVYTAELSYQSIEGSGQDLEIKFGAPTVNAWSTPSTEATL